MTIQLQVQPITVLSHATNASQTDDPRHPVSMNWAIDPTTGKAVARWVGEYSENIRNVVREEVA
jgi:hypothetical protein